MSEKYSGVLILNKPEGITSHDAVNKIRRIFKTKKVGHTGTLDPMATGVLPILVGHAVKASSFLVTDTKGYTAGMTLGVETDTQDTSGRIIAEKKVCCSDDEIREAILSFQGASRQLPPMYSALKVGGKKLCDLARLGIEVEREPRDIYIEKIFNIKKRTDTLWEFSVVCSKGTYIRTLISDIGEKLGCGAAMNSLKRDMSGSFLIETAYTFEQIESAERPEDLLIPTEQLFSSLPKVELSEFYTRLARNGQPVFSSRAKLSLPDVGSRITLWSNDGIFFALGEVVEHEGEKCARSIKMFDLP